VKILAQLDLTEKEEKGEDYLKFRVCIFGDIKA
jgi:hypothetical protein